MGQVKKEQWSDSLPSPMHVKLYFFFFLNTKHFFNTKHYLGRGRGEWEFRVGAGGEVEKSNKRRGFCGPGMTPMPWSDMSEELSSAPSREEK